MSCNQPNCDDPTNYNSTDVSVHQEQQDGVDTCSCSVNALMYSVSEQLSQLLGSSVNIDINKFIECYRNVWGSADYSGLPSQFRKAVQECLKINGYSDEQIADMIKNMNKFIKIQSWLFNRNKKSQLSEKNLFLPITCSSSVQSYNESTDYNCSRECSIPVKLTFKSDSDANLNNVSLDILPQKLCEHGPIICTFSGENFRSFFNSAKSSSDISNAIYEWNGQQFNEPVSACGFIHTVTLVGYECEPSVNPTHYIFKFKDSYEYGSGENKRPGYFYIKIPINSLSQKAPWSVGDKYWFGGNFRIFGVNVILKDLTNESLQDLISTCCPSPSPSPSLQTYNIY